jgi:hypothetical protein
MMEQGEIDPVRYGVLWERVQNMDKKMDKMELQISELLELANRGKGGLWFGMTIVSFMSAIIGFAIAWFKR